MKKEKVLKALQAAALACLILVVFAQCAGFDYLRFDDRDYTFGCMFVKDGLSQKNILAAFSSATHAAIWMPLTYISYMCDISFWGGGAGAHHFGNVVIHILNALLLLLLVITIAKRMDVEIGKSLRFFLAGVFLVSFWAIHPQRVEPVAWIAGRKDLLCVSFILLSLLVWQKVVAFSSEEKGGFLGKSSLYFLCVVFSACSCMCKPAAMCLPFLLICEEFLLRRYCSLKKAGVGRIVTYLPFFVMASGVGALAVYSQTHAHGYDVRDLFTAPLWWRLLNASVALGLYLFKTVLPFGIHLDYRAIPNGMPLGWHIGLMTLVVAGYGVYYLWKRYPAQRTLVVCSLIWFFSSIGPTLGIFGSFGEHALADRFYYLPSISLILFAAVFIVQFSKSADLLKVKSMAVPAVIVFALAALAFNVTRSYRDDYSVFSRTLDCDSNHWRALSHVGEGDCAKGNLDEGIEKLRKSFKISPRLDTKGKLAYALMRRGKNEDFGEIFKLCDDVAKNRKLDKKGQILEALGTAALVKRNWNEAMLCLYDSLRAPKHFYSKEDARLKLAYALYNAGRKAEAEKWFASLEKSTRADISKRASQALELIQAIGSGNAILYW